MMFYTLQLVSYALAFEFRALPAVP